MWALIIYKILLQESPVSPFPDYESYSQHQDLIEQRTQQLQKEFSVIQQDPNLNNSQKQNLLREHSMISSLKLSSDIQVKELQDKVDNQIENKSQEIKNEQQSSRNHDNIIDDIQGSREIISSGTSNTKSDLFWRRAKFIAGAAIWGGTLIGAAWLGYNYGNIPQNSIEPNPSSQGGNRSTASPSGSSTTSVTVSRSSSRRSAVDKFGTSRGWW